MSLATQRDTLSVIIPIYNELGSVKPLYEKLDSVLKDLNWDYEVLFVDDGSTDGTREILKQIAEKDPHIKLIFFSRNYGQTAAMSAGFQFAQNNIIIAMDGDLQNDPADIPRLLAKIEEGYDVVSGWRHTRKDPLLSRQIPSRLANKIISWIGGVHLKDYGCTLKAYRSSYIRKIQLFGEMHRFIPIYAHGMGRALRRYPSITTPAFMENQNTV